MIDLRKYNTYNVWFFVVAIWAAVCVSLSDFLDNPIQSFFGGGITVAYYLVVVIYSSCILYIVGLNKYVAFICLPIYGLIGVTVAYYRVKFKITISPMIVNCVLNTNMQEASGVVSGQLVGWILFNIIIVIFLLIWRFKVKSFKKHRWIYLSIVLSILFLFTLSGRILTGLNSRYPLNVLSSLQKNVQYIKKKAIPRQIPQSISYTIPQNIDVVFIIGESVRSDHLQLNGYHRQTTPFLSRRQNIYSFNNIYTPYGFTSQSVPYIMTRSDNNNPSRDLTETSFVSIFDSYHFNTVWIENQIICESFRHMPCECDTAVFLNMGKSNFAKVYDEDVLPIIEQQLGKNNRNLFVIHTAGSHWYYNNYLPESQMFFKPITDDRVITQNTREQIINSYDNTILYLDFVLDAIIQKFEKKCAVMIYLSDHGESLGENGNWLHQGAEETKNPACIIWFSNMYAELFPEKVEAVKINKNRCYETDFLFHSILSAINVFTEDYDPSMDVFAHTKNIH